MTVAVVSKKGWIVIPAELRRKHNLRPGDRVAFVDHGETIIVFPIPNDPIRATAGMLSGGPSMTAEVVAEHARERDLEDHDAPLRA